MIQIKRKETVYYNFIDLLKNKSIRTVYQPIVSLVDGDIVGYEALSRGPKSSSLESPMKLFEVAEKFNRLWELELLCRLRALENGIDLPKGKLLFMNVNPNIINDKKFKKGTTKDYISKFGLSPTEIIFEITEKKAVNNYKAFRNTIENYISQGYKIAIDDMGAGYSGLRMLAETQPQYIKIDMDLIRNIDKDIIKQELIRTFYAFSEITSMKLIAEGIETVDELNTLIDIGVHYGQGYFLQRPAEKFSSNIEFEISQHIIKRKIQSTIRSEMNINDILIGEIARLDKSIEINDTIQSVIKIFDSNSCIQGVVVTDQNVPLGLIMKQQLALYIQKHSSRSDFENDCVCKLMTRIPLIVDYHCSLNTTCRKALSRRDDHLYDYIIVSKNNKYYGIIPIRVLFNTLIEVNNSKDRSKNTKKQELEEKKRNAQFFRAL